jgi:hypothetical protein
VRQEVCLDNQELRELAAQGVPEDQQEVCLDNQELLVPKQILSVE